MPTIIPVIASVIYKMSQQVLDFMQKAYANVKDECQYQPIFNHAGEGDRQMCTMIT